jgi:hypothetical protein
MFLFPSHEAQGRKTADDAKLRPVSKFRTTQSDHRINRPGSARGHLQIRNDGHNEHDDSQDADAGNPVHLYSLAWDHTCDRPLNDGGVATFIVFRIDDEQDSACNQCGNEGLHRNSLPLETVMAKRPFGRFIL